MEHLKEALLNQMGTVIKLSVIKKRLRKNKKRVVSTLFLFLLLFILSCDFKPPVEWEPPGWYFDLTLPLIDKEYSFAELLDDTLFYSGTAFDSVSDVIHVTYPVTIDTQKIDDALFNIDMSSLGVEIPDLGISEPLNLQVNDSTSTSLQVDLVNISQYGDCFPDALVAGVPIVPVSGDIPLEFLELTENDLFKLKSMSVHQGKFITVIKNNLPFPINVDFTLDNGAISLYNTGNTLHNIQPYSPSESFEQSFNDKVINFEEDLTFQLTGEVPNGTSPNPCTTYICVPNPTVYYDEDGCDGNCEELECQNLVGWPIQGDQPGVDLTFKYEFNNISNVVIDFFGIEDTIISGIEIPGFDEIEIKKVLFSTTEVDTNMLSIDIENNTPVSLNLQFELLNLYFDDTAGDNISKIIEIAPNSSIPSQDESGQIDFNGYTMVSLENSPGDDFSSLEIIDLLAYKVIYSLEPAEYEIPVIDNQITMGIKFNGIVIGNMNLDYIAAITENMTFPAESAPIEGIPDGFSDIEFMDFIMQIELFNEIGIPDSILLILQGIKGNELGNPIDINTAIGVPFGENYGCTFEDFGDTVRTLITMDRDSTITEYYCNTADGLYALTGTFPVHAERVANSDASSIKDLLNFVPERIDVDGNIKIDGEGILSKGAGIWGKVTLESPLSFIFNKPMTIIPADPWPLPAIDDPATAEEIKSALVAGEFYVDIINRSPGGGTLSLLISDSTIFPLFFDSLVTGTWAKNQNEQKSYYNGNTIDTQIWDSLNIGLPDSIHVTPWDEDFSNFGDRALEVEFFHYPAEGETINYFIGRMFDLEFPEADSIDNSLGYAIPAFPGIYTSSVDLDTNRLNWLLTDQPRYSNALIAFDGSPLLPQQYITDEDSLKPLTVQTSNAIEIKAYLTLQLDSGALLDTSGLNRETLIP